MPSGLVALLDDVAGLTKLAAASLDDVGAAAGRAGSKAVGVVIDDAAVTPGYVTGLSPDRELPIVRRIAVGSLRNKLLILVPVALLLSAVAPWSLTPLLMLGGAYLCFEGAEKVLEALGLHDHAHEAPGEVKSGPEVERATVSGAVRTDLILSAEIVAITLADVAAQPLLTRAIVLVLVSIAITVGVYGAVALIVKMDDIGLHLSRRGGTATRAFGRGLVLGMPVVMRALTGVGTAAMIWVGGGILLHGAETYGLRAPAEALHHAAEAAADATGALGPVAAWAVQAAGAGVLGLIVGGLLAGMLMLLPRRSAASAH